MEKWKKENDDKDGKSQKKLMRNAVQSKAIQNLRNRIDVRLVSNEKDYLKWISKPSYMTQIVFNKDLIAIRKNQHLLEFANQI